MAWNATFEPLEHAIGRRYCLHLESAPMASDCFFSHLNSNKAFRSFFIQTLQAIPYAAFRWETPPLTSQNMDQPFEFVAIDDASLIRPASTRAFADSLRNAPPSSVIHFPNLGADAILVVPTPTGNGDRLPTTTSAETDQFCHLADFCHQAELDQQHKLWRTVAQTLLKRIGSKPVWLSTAGDGVPWLHVRLDDYPKYYAHDLYCIYDPEP